MDMDARIAKTAPQDVHRTEWIVLRDKELEAIQKARHNAGLFLLQLYSNTKLSTGRRVSVPLGLVMDIA